MMELGPFVFLWVEYLEELINLRSRVTNIFFFLGHDLV